MNPWGPPLESSLRLVLGDEDVSGVLVIDIVTDQTQYSCYIYGIPVIRTVMLASGTWCVKLSATRSKVPHHAYTWWGPPPKSVGATSRILTPPGVG